MPPTRSTAPGTPVIAAISEERTSRTHRICSLGGRVAVGSNSINVAWPSLLRKLSRIGWGRSSISSAVSDIPAGVGRDKTSSALGSRWKRFVKRLTASQPAGESGGDCGGNSRTTRRDCTIPDLPMPCSVRSARTDSAAAGSESWSGIPGEILLAWNARISSGTPATSRAVQGQRVMMLPHRTHRSLAAQRLSRVLNCLPGRRTLAALMRCPSRPSTQGRMNVHSTTLRTVTSRPAIPMERSSLLTVPISELRSIGIAGLLVTVLSVVLCTFILPWVLGLLGHRINAARVRLPGRQFKTRESLCTASERWVRWGSIITRWPWTALLVAGVPLLILAFQASRISPGIPDHDSLPAAAESVRALRTLQGMGRSGIVQSLRVVLELPAQSPPLSPAGWLAVSRLTKRFQSDPRAEEVLSLPTLAGMSDTADEIDDLPQPIRESFLSSDGQATLIELLPTATLPPNEQIR